MAFGSKWSNGKKRKPEYRVRVDLTDELLLQILNIPDGAHITGFKRDISRNINTFFLVKSDPFPGGETFPTPEGQEAAQWLLEPKKII